MTPRVFGSKHTDVDWTLDDDRLIGFLVMKFDLPDEDLRWAPFLVLCRQLAAQRPSASHKIAGTCSDSALRQRIEWMFEINETICLDKPHKVNVPTDAFAWPVALNDITDICEAARALNDGQEEVDGWDEELDWIARVTTFVCNHLEDVHLPSTIALKHIPAICDESVKKRGVPRQEMCCYTCVHYNQLVSIFDDVLTRGWITWHERDAEVKLWHEDPEQSTAMIDRTYTHFIKFDKKTFMPFDHFWPELDEVMKARSSKLEDQARHCIAFLQHSQLMHDSQNKDTTKPCYKPSFEKCWSQKGDQCFSREILNYLFEDFCKGCRFRYDVVGHKVQHFGSTHAFRFMKDTLRIVKGAMPEEGPDWFSARRDNDDFEFYTWFVREKRLRSQADGLKWNVASNAVATEVEPVSSNKRKATNLEDDENEEQEKPSKIAKACAEADTQACATDCAEAK